MNINIITLFPEIFDSLNYGLLGQALDREDIKINIFNLRDHQLNKHGQIDDKPYGGGEGMVLMAEPLENAIKNIPSDNLGIVINLSPQGTIFSQKKAKELSKLKNITIICGRYEGIDERLISQYVDDEISIGDYVLSGGEIPALVLTDSIMRIIPGAISDETSALTDSFQDNLIAPPVYTRPSNFMNLRVPEVLLSGNKKLIDKWRENKSIENTKKRRPDLI